MPVGTMMEIFKTSVGSWIYPEPSFFRIAGVPLFSGFMYSCVGSYIARAWRLFDFRFTHHPPRWPRSPSALRSTPISSPTILASTSASILFVAAALLFGPTNIHFRVWHVHRAMPLLLGFLLVALLHLAFRKYRHLHQNLALSLAAARLVAGLARQSSARGFC